MASLSKRLSAAYARKSATEKTVEVAPGVEVLLRKPSYGEQIASPFPDDWPDEHRRRVFWGVSLTVRDPKSGDLMFDRSDKGWQEWLDLPADLVAKLVGACDEFLSVGDGAAEQKKRAPARKKSSRRKSARRS